MFITAVCVLFLRLVLSNKTVTYLGLKSSSEAWNRLNEGSICGTREAEGAFEGLLNCCKRDHKSLYSRSSLGYSPSNACFKNVDARIKGKYLTKQKNYVTLPSDWLESFLYFGKGFISLLK